MKQTWRYISTILVLALLALGLTACGGDPFRFDPGPPATPVGLSVIAGDGQVALSWAVADKASAYNVYYSSSAGVNKESAAKVSTITGNTTIVTGLTNDVTYYFAVAAVNSNSESALSNEVSVTTVASGSYQQGNLLGSWRFNILATGASAGWMRGTLDIDGEGRVSVTSFLDSTGNITAPAALFTSMFIAPDGSISGEAPSANFRGVLSAGQYRDLLVATSSFNGNSRLLYILRKRVPGITFSSSDIKGTGRLVAGPLPFVYHQLASGPNREWEQATGQIGQDQTVKYDSIAGPSVRQLPGAGSKVTTLTISADGIVTEAPIAGVLPQPAALITNGVMSADKMTIIGTATDAGGAFVLRIIQFIHPPSISLTAANYTLAGMAGTYRLQALVNGAASRWISASLNLDSTGTAVYGSYLDSSGSDTLPASLPLLIDQQGILTSSVDHTFNGQLSYFRDLYVATRTDATGGYSLELAMKR